MSILSTSPQTEIAVRNKRNSDLNELLNKGLTIENKRQQSSHGLAAASNRDTKMELEINYLERQTDEDYFNELFKEID